MAYFKALFQPSRIGIRSVAGIRIFDIAFRPALVKVALPPGLIWPERTANHSLSIRYVIKYLLSHSPRRLRRTVIITGQGCLYLYLSRRELNPGLTEYNAALTTQL